MISSDENEELSDLHILNNIEFIAHPHKILLVSLTHFNVKYVPLMCLKGNQNSFVNNC